MIRLHANRENQIMLICGKGDHTLAKKNVERIRRIPSHGVAALRAFGIDQRTPFRDCIDSLLIDLINKVIKCNKESTPHCLAKVLARRKNCIMSLPEFHLNCLPCHSFCGLDIKLLICILFRYML